MAYRACVHRNNCIWYSLYLVAFQIKMSKDPTPAYKAAVERRRSGAADIHQDKRTKRKRTRSAQKKAAIKEQS